MTTTLEDILQVKPDIEEKLKKFNQLDQTNYADLVDIQKQFVRKFQIDKIKEMTPEDYSLGTPNSKESFCYWLEFETFEIGSIKGGWSPKFVLYFDKNKDDYWFKSEFDNKNEALFKIKEDIVKILELADQSKYVELNNYKAIFSDLLKTKIVSLYYPEEFLVISKDRHIIEFLRKLGIKFPERLTIGTHNILLNRLLHNEYLKDERFKKLHYYEFVNFLYNAFPMDRKYWKIEPRSNAKNWQECKEGNKISIDYEQVGNLAYDKYEELRGDFIANCDKDGDFYTNEGELAEKKVNRAVRTLWNFKSIEAGDIIVANKGKSIVKGIGIARNYEDKETPYYYEEDKGIHNIYVNWLNVPEKVIPTINRWQQTIVELDYEIVYDIFKDSQKEGKEEIGDISDYLEIFVKIKKILEKKGQIILYGPPGTGKTYVARKFSNWFIEHNEEVNIGEQFCFITFHPSYSYEDFIEGYKPTASKNSDLETGQKVRELQGFELRDGVFKEFCFKANQDKKNNYLLIIDEINRGNMPKIFGEIITLIELDKRNVPIKLASGDSFLIPPNLYIIGTMNTADRSIKLLDSALKRRFAFFEMMPDYEIEQLQNLIEDKEIQIKDILIKINGKIIEYFGRDKQIGHSYFMNYEGSSLKIEDLKDIFQYEIIPLVQEYCYDDFGKLQDIFGKKFFDSKNKIVNREIFDDNNTFTATLIEYFPSLNPE